MTTRVLFMCVANSARSQMAEGIARQILGAGYEIASAGSAPTRVNPIGVKAMQEIGIDISKGISKKVADLSPDFVQNLDYVITLCAEEVCPVLPGSKAKKLHWPLLDPANAALSEAEQLANFRNVRDQISRRLKEWEASADLGVS